MTTHAPARTRTAAAPDSVPVESARARFAAITGPCGSGRPALPHCLAGLDRATAGSVRTGDTELTGLNDRQLTRLRRERTGSVFPAFALRATLTALERMRRPDPAQRTG